MIVHMIGNAHVDPVWLWGWQAGADEVLATFRSAADRCDEYPEFVFTAGEAWRYDLVERLDPGLFERVRSLVAAGRWHPTGSQWVQPDCNLPTAAGWREQLRIGTEYFRSRFGVEPATGYNVDSFGHPATLPTILRAAGISRYVFCRPVPEQLELPANLFRWRGPDGAEVLAFRMVPTYVTRSANMRGQVQLALDSAAPGTTNTMCFYGIGNHGGGPTKGQIEWILANRHAIDGVELVFSNPDAFFDAVAAEASQLPVFDGELQHVFPGCYSVMHDIKQRQRRGEHLLEQARETLEHFEAGSPDGPATRVREAWRDLAFTQFHDILAGTSAPSAYDSVRAIQGRAIATGQEVLFDATRRWARAALPPVNEVQVVAINTGAGEWQGLVESEPWLDGDDWGDRWVADEAGNPVPFQLCQPETPLGLTRLLWPATIAARGATTVRLVDARWSDQARVGEPAAPGRLQASPAAMSGERLQVTLGPTGIGGLRLDGEDLLGPGGISLHLRDDQGDNWVFHSDDLPGEVVARADGLQWVVEETGPLRARARAETRLLESQVRWTVDLRAGETAVRIRLEVLFGERHRALQLRTELAHEPTAWTDGIPGGRVQRTPGSPEWPVQGWSSVVAGDRRMAWLTQDAYSVSLGGQAWQWTLLRSPRMGWMGENAGIYAGRDHFTDQGHHVFDMVLRVGEEITLDDLDREAEQLARPPVVFDRYEGLDRPPWGDIAPESQQTGQEARALDDPAAPEAPGPAGDAGPESSE